MKWNPLLSAGAAAAYIGAVALFMRFIESVRHDTPDTILDGMSVISLFVFSAAVMAFLFFYQPALRLAKGDAAGAVSYFVKTFLLFGMLTFALLIFASIQ